MVLDCAMVCILHSVSQETVLKSVRHSDGQEITIRIQLVKVLPPAACRQLYNVVFRRFASEFLPNSVYAL